MLLANNERTDLPLPDGADNPSVISLFVSEGRIYAAGGYDIDGNQIDVACIWVDGQRIDLTGSGEEGQCASIVVDNGTIYAAGYFDANNSKSACYWKIPEGGRPERVDLDMPEWSEDPLALSATISDGKLYLAGVYSDADYKSYSNYWTDGVRTDLLASENATAYSIAVDGSDVYVAGDYGENYTPPCYWKNGALTLLPLYGEPYYNLITAKVCDGSF